VNVGWLRQLERAARAVLVRALAMLMRMPPNAGPPDWRARPFRVLYLRYNAIGDMIMATGIMRAIAGSYSTLTVDVLASPANAPVLERASYVRDVITFDRRRISSYVRSLLRVRRSRYDVVVDGMAAAPKPATALIMLASGARYRVGIARGRTRLYTLPARPKAEAGHHVEYMAAVLEPFGLDVSSVDLRTELSVTDDERAWAEQRWNDAGIAEVARRSQRLLINVSAGRPWRRWPDERFEAVMRSLRAHHAGMTILVIADLKEFASSQRIAAAGGGMAVRATIREAFALVATADLVLTPDTSISHAAGALGTPAVVMIPRHISDFVPYRAEGQNVFADTGDVLSIGIDEVLAAVKSTLAESASTPARAAT
jgi:ADP-heptose:LPS heptosyltransferase